jgi:ABC-type uncharacterized transport system permease subunit
MTERFFIADSLKILIGLLVMGGFGLFCGFFVGYLQDKRDDHKVINELLEEIKKLKNE